MIFPYNEQELANAIVAQAAHDYITAKINGGKGLRQYLEFFAGQDYSIYTSVEPKILLEELDKAAEVFAAKAEELVLRAKNGEKLKEKDLVCPVCGFKLNVTTNFHHFSRRLYGVLYEYYGSRVKCKSCTVTRKFIEGERALNK